MIRSPSAVSVLSIALAAPVASALMPPPAAAVPVELARAAAAVDPDGEPAVTRQQGTGEGETTLQLTPAEHGRLVDVLATEAERAEWDTLADTAAREAFLERFWRLRDPTPGTADNEVRDLFMRRAARAESLFGDDDEPGWATPRGRALLVYGLPDEQERRSTGEEPELRWTWNDAPGSVTIRFSPAPGDRWVFREESEPELDWEAFAANARERLRLPVSRAEDEPPEEAEPEGAGPDEADPPTGSEEGAEAVEA
ncbi:MAG: GWxTD domain-containing protein, partial [Acidobacteriota bacterium]